MFISIQAFEIIINILPGRAAPIHTSGQHPSTLCVSHSAFQELSIPPAAALYSAYTASNRNYAFKSFASCYLLLYPSPAAQLLTNEVVLGPVTTT